ncbi:phage head closure protein [Metabacillus sp. 22489]|uniref:phage head closure protein n=1 Tax=Metabacillus sp. 22489 TaxID=3453928 RepID=UPI003F873425
MNPARLDCRIEIGENKSIKDPITKINQTKWVPFHTCWAEKDEPTGRSFYQAAVAHLEYVTWFNIRSKKGIKPDMLVKYKDRTFKIENIKYGSRKENLDALQCREVI